jgi:hypothetical protein
VFQIKSATAAVSPENFRFYTTEKSETGVVMGEISSGRLVKRSNSKGWTNGHATALVFHDSSLYVGGSYTEASNNALSPKDNYRTPFFMKLSDDISTVTWSYTEIKATTEDYVKTVDHMEAHYTAFTDVIWAISRKVNYDFSSL